ncbi:MAG: N-acetyltransferase [Thermoproteota archaeon]|nr:MAG: N-acetyltransferase [Candidatus Korarchaeota archaeon]
MEQSPGVCLAVVVARGKKVGLAVLSREHLDKFVKWVNDPEVTVYLNIQKVFTLEDELEWYEQVRKSGRDRVFAIVELESKRVIGVIGLHRISYYNRNAELGIFIGEKELWGQGYGEEAVKLMLDYAFNVLNLHMVYLRVKDFNRRAISCYRKVGFREAGRIRDMALQPDGYHDVILMDILEEEFNSRYESFYKRIQEKAAQSSAEAP